MPSVMLENDAMSSMKNLRSVEEIEDAQMMSAIDDDDSRLVVSIKAR